MPRAWPRSPPRSRSRCASETSLGELSSCVLSRHVVPSQLLLSPHSLQAWSRPTHTGSTTTPRPIWGSTRRCRTKPASRRTTARQWPVHVVMRVMTHALVRGQRTLSTTGGNRTECSKSTLRLLPRAHLTPAQAASLQEEDRLRKQRARNARARRLQQYHQRDEQRKQKDMLAQQINEDCAVMAHAKQQLRCGPRRSTRPRYDTHGHARCPSSVPLALSPNSTPPRVHKAHNTCGRLGRGSAATRVTCA